MQTSLSRTIKGPDDLPNGIRDVCVKQIDDYTKVFAISAGPYTHYFKIKITKRPHRFRFETGRRFVYHELKAKFTGTPAKYYIMNPKMSFQTALVSGDQKDENELREAFLNESLRCCAGNDIFLDINHPDLKTVAQLVRISRSLELAIATTEALTSSFYIGEVTSEEGGIYHLQGWKKARTGELRKWKVTRTWLFAADEVCKYFLSDNGASSTGSWITKTNILESAIEKGLLWEERDFGYTHISSNHGAYLFGHNCWILNNPRIIADARLESDNEMRFNSLRKNLFRRVLD